MSQPLLTLRAPANVDWIQGFPGIPPSSQFDRPHAAVKGTIEVRPSQPLKAKWLRIELRKVETLPAGAGVFFDHIGQSPITLWQAQEEWGMLETCDMPFHIRIPESVPPSLTLEKGSGIRYELVASVCSKGKKGLLRKDAATIVTATAPIVIDKHELHSTWPIYSQGGSKVIRQGAVELEVTRTHTCYGPGDRVSVSATVKSDDLSACVLRTLEFALREQVVFRTGPQGHGKKSGPQVRNGGVGEQRINANMTLYGGTQYRSELSCVVPPGHSTATVSSARHIDVSYLLHVRATLDSGKLLSLELPVTISNWPRQVSIDAVKRIGVAPNLSLPSLLPRTVAPDTINSPANEPLYSTLPNHQLGGLRTSSAVDDWGVVSPGTTAQTLPGRGHATAASLDVTPSARGAQHVSSPSMPNVVDLMGSPGVSSVPGSSSTIAPFGSASTPSGSSGRPLTGGSIANGKKIDLLAGEELVPAQPPTPPASANRYPQGRRPSAHSSPTPAPVASLPPVRPASTARPWPTAEDEKRKLYEKAVTAANRAQSRMVLDGTGAASGSSSHTRTLSANVVVRQSESPRRMTSMDSMGSARSIQTMATGPTVSDGAALYQQALANMPQTSRTGPRQGTSPPNSPPARVSQLPVSRSYPSASDEKAALAYQAARRAVERHQSSDSDAPIPYEALFPPRSGSGSQAQHSSPPASSLGHGTRSTPPTTPPPARHGVSLPGSPTPYQTSFAGGSSSSSSAPPLPSVNPIFDPAIPEKERIRRAFEARDAAAAAAGIGVAPAILTPIAESPAYAMPSPVPYVPTQPANGTPLPSDFAESSAHFHIPRSSSPTDSSSHNHTGGGSSSRRPQPVPPINPGSPRPLTAAEEKARLQAQYDAEDVETYSPQTDSRPRTAGSTAEPRDPEIRRGKMRETDSPPISTTPPPPPPLPPRPPRDYIAETVRRDTQSQEQLARLLASAPFSVSDDAPPLPPKLPILQ